MKLKIKNVIIYVDQEARNLLFYKRTTFFYVQAGGLNIKMLYLTGFF